MGHIASTETVNALLGVDTGGTFTDFVFYSAQGCRIHKVLSTPESPERAILQGIGELGIADEVAQGNVAVVHGSTVATNAALEKKGVSTAYVTNRGFADLLTLARQNRPDIYQLSSAEIEPPVPESLCVEVNTRCNHLGELDTALTDDELITLKQKIDAQKPQAVAINLLYSFLRDDEERRIATLLEKDYFVCRSSEVLPEYKEYERGVATWLNAWLGPKVEGYLNRLREALVGAPLAVMQSSGGTIAAQKAARRAVNLLLSGPAGGLAAALHVGKQIGSTKLLTFDMGGTSTDVALINDQIRLTSEARLADYPIAVPMVDMHTIGAGGGSLAYLDRGGLLHVGPQSSGADPGPACYGKGGLQATVTDANVVLGRLRSDFFLGGKMALDLDAAKTAVDQLAKEMGVTLQQAAEGVIALANEHMARALRVISVQKGFDPKDFELCCFGGAGGLHVCALADALGMTRILVPSNGGVLSALGMLVAPRQRDVSKSVLQLVNDAAMTAVVTIQQQLQGAAIAELRDEGVSGEVDCSVVLECRYQGQSFHLALPWEPWDSVNRAEQIVTSFHDLHKKTFGYALGLPVELVNVRVQVRAPIRQLNMTPTAKNHSSHARQSVNLPGSGVTQVIWREALTQGERLAGPTIICETVATTWVAANWCARVDEFGHLRLTKGNH